MAISNEDRKHSVGVSYDNMQVSLSTNKESLHNQAHGSQYMQSPPFIASNNPFSRSSAPTPIALGHSLHATLTLDGPLPKLGFEKKSVSSSMFGVEDWSSTVFQEKQKVYCDMEVYASPSPHAHEKQHSKQLYRCPLAYKDLDNEKIHHNTPACIDDSYSSIDGSYSLFETKATEFGAETLDASRYFRALKGPELETLKKSEHIVLPMDRKWPFLLRFPICFFAINLGLGSQAILWRILAIQGYLGFKRIPILVNLVIWCMAIMMLITISTTYALKGFFYFEAVRREFNHPIRINFFFTPWVACMLLALGVPPSIATTIHPNIWILLTIPILALDLKVYGDWVFGGKRHLCKVANPSTHLSLMGNFISALLIATVGYMELALFFWSIGFLHYLVLLVTLYQRLPSATVLPRELHPVFFLFVALPNSASVSWAKIMGEFDLVAKLFYFIAMFLFFSLVAKFRIFYGFRFNISWWAYTFPFTVSAISTIRYSLEVKHPFTQTMAVLLTIASSLIVLSLAIVTMLHIFVWRSMFPNDIAIAITSKRVKGKREIKEIQEDTLPSYTSQLTTNRWIKNPLSALNTHTNEC